MAWPGSVSSGELITAAYISSIATALATWPGDADGGGYDLTNVAVLQLVGDAAKPGAAAGYRGMVWITRGGAGTADLVEICIKNAADGYEWIALF